MITYGNTDIIGLQPVVEDVKKKCEMAKLYYGFGIQPEHYLLNLPAGEGQTTLTEYIAFAFKEYRVRRFGGLDIYLEYHLNGSMEQLNRIMEEIDTSAVYTNKYEVIISFDITALAEHIHERQVEFFLEELQDIGDNATLIFYYNDTKVRNMDILLEKIRGKSKEQLKEIYLDPYSMSEITMILKKLIRDANVRFVDESDLMIEDLIHKRGIDSLKKCISLSRILIYNSKHVEGMAIIDPEVIANVVSMG